jgi:hypothetical protein
MYESIRTPDHILFVVSANARYYTLPSQAVPDQCDSAIGEYPWGDASANKERWRLAGRVFDADGRQVVIASGGDFYLFDACDLAVVQAGPEARPVPDGIANFSEQLNAPTLYDPLKDVLVEVWDGKFCVRGTPPDVRVVVRNYDSATDAADPSLRSDECHVLHRETYWVAGSEFGPNGQPLKDYLASR